MSPSRLSLLFIVMVWPCLAAPAQVMLSPAEAEVQKCEDKIQSVRRDVLGKYEDQLSELQTGFQKAADLEGALAVRNERTRLTAEHDLNDRDLVNEPKSLRAIQTASIARMRELVSSLVQDTLPRLIEFKKQLTVAGKLDEAVNVRAAIEQLQNNNVPIAKVDAGAIVPAETLLLAYGGDRGRADKTYKNQKVTVRGILGGYRQDPADTKHFQLFLTGTSGSGWIQCSYSANDFRFREEKGSFGAVTFVVSRDNDSVRLQKGQTVEIRGVCLGLDELVKLDRCEMPK